MNENLAIGHTFAEIAANHAGAIWRDDAFSAFCEYAKSHQFFTTEQVRAANPDLPTPPDDRAWGAIAIRAKREKLIAGNGWVISNTRTAHGRVITQWESKIYRGSDGRGDKE